jgi:cytochrome c oxidase cbb3-type subunit III
MSAADRKHDRHGKQEEEQNRVIHEVDGIQEYDNKLPNWWLFTLYAAIAFAVGYWFHYHQAKFGDGPSAEYEAEMEKVNAAQAAKLKSAPVMTPEALTALAKDKGTVDTGKQVFTTTCAACHRADAGGLVGPNLTDEFWLHGAAPEKVYKSVATGIPDKGMPAWGQQLGPDRVSAVVAYVLTLRGTNVPNGKAPQGERDGLSAQ